MAQCEVTMPEPEMGYPTVLALNGLQEQHGRWLDRNFPDLPVGMQALRVVGEVGELAQSIAKAVEGIGDKEAREAEVKDAVGDILLALCGFCHKAGISLGYCVEACAEDVWGRDWKTFPRNGRTE